MNEPLRALWLKLTYDLRLQKATLAAQQNFMLNMDVCVVQASITQAKIVELEQQISEVKRML